MHLLPFGSLILDELLTSRDRTNRRSRQTGDVTLAATDDTRHIGEARLRPRPSLFHFATTIAGRLTLIGLMEESRLMLLLLLLLVLLLHALIHLLCDSLLYHLLCEVLLHGGHGEVGGQVEWQPGQ